MEIYEMIPKIWVSRNGGTPSSLDGFFHGQSHSNGWELGVSLFFTTPPSAELVPPKKRHHDLCRLYALYTWSSMKHATVILYPYKDNSSTWKLIHYFGVICGFSPRRPSRIMFNQASIRCHQGEFWAVTRGWSTLDGLPLDCAKVRRAQKQTRSRDWL